MKIKGAIFDMDGTLIDSLETWNNMGSEYLISKGREPEKNLSYVIRDMSLEQAGDYFIKEYDIEDSVEKIVNDINKMIESKYFDFFKLKKGTMSLLNLFKKHDIKMCVATLTDIHLAEACLKRNKIMDVFSDIITCRQVGFSKDRPDIYYHALNCLETSKDETLIFEDALYAARTAKKAGFNVAAVHDIYQSHDEADLRQISDYYIESFENCEKQFIITQDGYLEID